MGYPVSVPIPWTGQGWSTISHSNSKGLGLVFLSWVCSCIFASSFRNKYNKHWEIGVSWAFWLLSLQMRIFPFRRHFTPCATPPLGLPPPYCLVKQGSFMKVVQFYESWHGGPYQPNNPDYKTTGVPHKKLYVVICLQAASKKTNQISKINIFRRNKTVKLQFHAV